MRRGIASGKSGPAWGTMVDPDILDLPVSATDRLWLLWRSADRELVSRVITRTVTRLVTRDALHCGAPAVETWAASWLSGDDRSPDAAHAAAEAAWAAARAAWAAARAAWAAEAAARSPESRVAWAAWAAATSSLADDAELAAQLDDWRAVLAEAP